MDKFAKRIHLRLVTAFRSSGVRGVAIELHRGLLYRVYRGILDRDRLGSEPAKINTVTQLERLSIESENRRYGVEYSPTPHSVLTWMFGALDIDYPAWNFVDIGSGRGRVVFAAARLPFKSVTGVEFADELHSDAMSVLDNFPATERVCRDIRLLRMDATKFDAPEGPCAFFLFNPFGAEVLEKFIDNALASHAANPRQMKFAYFNPTQAQIFDARPELVRKALGAFEWTKFACLSPFHFRIYETRPHENPV